MLSLLILLSPFVFAEKSFLDLSEVIQSVRDHAPGLVAAQKDYEKAQADQFGAQGGFDPILKTKYSANVKGYYRNTFLDVTVDQPTPLYGAKFYAGYRSGQGTFPPYDGRLETFSQGEVRGGVELPLLKNGSTDERRTRIQSASLNTQIADASFQSQELDLIRQATHRYWDWVAAGRKRKIANDLLKIALERDKALVHRVQHGDASAFELTENQRMVVQRESTVLKAERELQKASLELSLYFRGELGAPLLPEDERLPDNFPEGHHLEEKRDLQVIQSHPDFKKLDFQLQENQVQLRYAKNQLLPKLDLYAGAARDLGIAPNGTAYSAYYIPDYASEVKVGFQFELPLFLRTARGKVAGTLASQQKMEANLGLLRDRLKVQAENSYQALDVSLERVKLARKEIALSLKLEQGERIRFSHGDSTLLIVNLREQITVDAELREVEAWVDYWRAKADYQYAISQWKKS